VPEIDREESLQRIKTLGEKYGGNKLADANEAKTRLLVIDAVLEALGWTKEDFNPEEATHRTGYTDYFLRADEVPRLIVEAKRYDHTFHSPTSTLRKSDYTVAYMRRAFGPALADVLEQAERYAQETQVPFAVITNGQEWVLLQLVPMPGSTLNDLRCVYFGNLFGAHFVFELFWELLSKAAVSEGALEDYFSDLNRKEAEFSKAPKAELGDLRWAGPPEAPALLRDFYNLFFDEIVDPGRRRMLQQCFVSDSRLDQYKGELTRALKDSAPAYIPDARDISPSDRDALAPKASGDQKGRVIIVTGSVGCGKTTFVNKVLVEARQAKDDPNYFLYVDLIDEVGDATADFDTKVWRTLRDEWCRRRPDAAEYDTLTKVFGHKIRELRKGPRARVFETGAEEYRAAEATLLEQLSSDPEAFVSASWRHCHQLGHGVSVVFDNGDRASEDYQRHVYAFAHRVARETGATVIITMREATFFRGQGRFLDVRSSDTVLHLSAPDLVRLMSKRIKYIETELEQDHRAGKWRKSYDWDEFKTSVNAYASTLKCTFLTGGAPMRELLAAVSWHDVRQFLMLVRRLHVTLGIEVAAWDFKAVLAALMAPGANPEHMVAVVPNIYEPPFPNYDCYFVKLRILALLHYALPPAERRRGKELPFILRVTRMYGYQERWTRKAVRDLVRERCLECIQAPAAAEYARSYELDDTHTFRVSPLAVLLLDSLASDGGYVALSGNGLSFHREDLLRKYVEVLQDTGVASGLTVETVGRLMASQAAQIVGAYLVDRLAMETPPNDVSRALPEAQMIGERIRALMATWSQPGATQQAQQQQPTDTPQLPLFGPPVPGERDEGGRDAKPHLPGRATLSPSFREAASSAKIEGSTLGPLIFAALALLKHDGMLPTTGAEITRTINTHLVDDHHRKEPTNVSRALRRPVLRRQPWLAVSVATGSGAPRYSLTAGWEQEWERLFGVSYSPKLLDETDPPPQ